MKITALKFLLFLTISPLAFGQDVNDFGGLLHDAGFSVFPTRIDGPDYYGEEPLFQEAYEELKSRYGNDYLPADLPDELKPIRAEIQKFIESRSDKGATSGGKTNEFLRLVRNPETRRVVLTTYRAGENGEDNGRDFNYDETGMADKLTRLSYCFGISPRILTALVHQESKFVASAVSGTGAVSLMQITNVAAVEVSEQLGLGYNVRAANHNPAGKDIYEEYINCYLTDVDWMPPWLNDLPYVENGEIIEGEYIIDASHAKSTTKDSAGNRIFRQPYASRVDRWLSGKLEVGSSHDHGLIYGAVLLKFYLGHMGITGGVRKYNGDNARKTCFGARQATYRCYQKSIFIKADTMDLETRRVDI